MRYGLRTPVWSVLALALCGTCAAQLPDPAALFDDGRVHDIELTVDDADWSALRRDFLLNTYYRAAFSSDGQALPVVGIRSRGSGSRSPEKPNLLVAFDRYDKTAKLFGLPGVVLKANNQDASLLRPAGAAARPFGSRHVPHGSQWR